MKKAITLLSSMALAMSIFSQTADFENFNLGVDEYLNGSVGSGGFYSGSFFFPNRYNDIWESWSGWAISSVTDNQTPGYGNQYSAITGSGADGNTYGVSFVDGHSSMHLPLQDGLSYAYSLKITNSTYAYLSMKDGDNYAKKFGGVDGNDPDFFLLTIKGYIGGQLIADSIDFYLADYRFSDNSMDYIVDSWVEVNTFSLGAVDSLTFTLSSSDVGVFGMNTPAYFCIDEVIFAKETNTTQQLPDDFVKIFPNPVVRELSVDIKEILKADAVIYAENGQRIWKGSIVGGVQKINVHTLPAGIYFLKIQTDEGWVSRRFVKK